ncbi:putative aminoglycoside phosphotransferase [Hoeflea phototrophica DFL-43]|uniref:Putative aminoglycoside phosphotransferase n=1 Tax=Hoeflea phototrophica (strain DSM 17068 / NCIMB 14078 / DFL-43) TaxID=411684 RepID=A9D9F0_HOEPD|nr:phosphotransferase [Hoeflea phototrophica]EDQ32927.1 putative aminoglycoside phosphotransferase [Hoeflea phototrophica DFL-43]
MDAEPFDMENLADELHELVPGFSGLHEIMKFNTGQSNPTYRVEADSGRYVLRAKPPGTLLKSAHQVDREYRVMKALADQGVPVPKVLGLSDEHSAIGRMYFVMELIEGHIFWDPALPETTMTERTAVYDGMNQVLAKLHSVDPEAAGLGDFGRPGNYFARQIRRWSEQYLASKTDELEDMDKLMSWLNENLPEDDGQVSVVHGDFRLDNMIFDGHGGHVLALIDWELSTLGHPMADLAYQCMQWRLPHDSGFRGLGGLDRDQLGIPQEAVYVARYTERSGIKADNWTFCLAFSFFRLASILQGVYKRSLDGNASNPERARDYGKAVPLLAMMAGDVITGKA